MMAGKTAEKTVGRTESSSAGMMAARMGNQLAVTKVYQRVAMKVEQMVHLWGVMKVVMMVYQMAAQRGLISVARTVALSEGQKADLMAGKQAERKVLTKAEMMGGYSVAMMAG